MERYAISLPGRTREITGSGRAGPGEASPGRVDPAAEGIPPPRHQWRHLTWLGGQTAWWWRRGYSGRTRWRRSPPPPGLKTRSTWATRRGVEPATPRSACCSTCWRYWSAGSWRHSPESYRLVASNQLRVSVRQWTQDVDLCWLNAEPTSQTAAQHWTNIRATPRSVSQSDRRRRSTSDRALSHMPEQDNKTKTHAL